MQAKGLITASLAASLTAFGVALACDCIDSGPFLIAARDAPVIIRGRVVSHIAHGLDVEAQETYRGEEARAVVRIWGGNGRNCRKYASQFPDQSEWIFALHRMSDGEFLLSGESRADFQISSCGEYAVQVVDGDAITFDEYGRERRVSLAELGERLREWGNLD